MTVPIAVARKAAGARKGAGGRAAAPRARGGAAPKAAPLPPEGTKARQQRDAIEAIKSSRPAQPVDDELAEQPQEPSSPPPASPGGGLAAPAMPAAASTGSGFLLGVFAWAVGLAYLNGGSDGVKKFLAAKFLNKT